MNWKRIHVRTKMKDAIVFYSSPGICHLVPIVELGRLILSRYDGEFSVIILLTNGPFDLPATVSYTDRVSQTTPGISFRRFPYLPFIHSPALGRLANMFEFFTLNAPNVLESLREISTTFSIRALILDIFCTSAFPLARSLRIPTFYNVPLSAAALATILYLPAIDKQTSKSFKDLPNTFFDIPGLPPLRATHMMDPVLDREDRSYHEAMRLSLDLRKCDGILINTFDALEPKALKAIANGDVSCPPPPPVYTVGPLIADALETGDTDDINKHECLSWLDQQPSRSVVFLCFGSRGSFCREQLKEIGNGLERSGVRFLWGMKIPATEENRKEIGKDTVEWSDFDLEDILPEGFSGKTKNRGMIVKSWVPQQAILRHPSVGSFVSHCGWASTMEAAATGGMPMVAWPLHAEQHINKAALVEDIKFAIALEQRDGDGFVSGDELEKKLRMLMDSDEGRELRERSRKIREMAAEAWKEKGSSATALDNLANIWRQEKLL